MYYFDFESAQHVLKQAADQVDERLRQGFEAFRTAYAQVISKPDLRAWSALRKEFRSRGCFLAKYPNEMPRGLPNALYSAKHGKPVGWQFGKLVDVAHRVASPSHRESLPLFARALEIYQRVEQLRGEDSTQNWARKARALIDARAAGELPIHLDPTWLPLVGVLFPELNTGRATSTE